MHYKNFLLSVVTCACVLAPCVSASAAETASAGDPRLTLSTGFDYSSGDYGQAIDTQILYVPVIAKLKYDGWTAKLTVPYISITGPGVVIGGNEGATAGTAGAKTTESGLGDVVGSLDYAFPVGHRGTTADLTGKIKFPTADSSRNLGTGEFDYTAQAGLTQEFGDFFVTGNGGRKFNGSSAKFNLNDVWKYSVGAGYSFTPATTVGLVYDFRQSATAVGDNISEATAFVSHKLNDSWAVQVYGVAGFSNASPNAGGGLQLSYKLDPMEIFSR